MTPNEYPSISAPYRIAIIGEAPGRDEVSVGRPFVGASGKLLTDCLSKSSILRSACFLGNVTQHLPNDNLIANFDWNGPEIQTGLVTLAKDLSVIKPNLILCLGATALHAFKAGNLPLQRGKELGKVKFRYPNSISDWRGSVFLSAPTSPLPNTKCLATLHPVACLREFSNTPLLALDLGRAYREGHYPDCRFPKRDIRIARTLGEVLPFLHTLRSTRTPVSADIEGYWNSISCIALSSLGRCLVIPFFTKDGQHYWSFEDELAILRDLSLLMADTSVPKTWQNGLYDRWCLQYGYSIPVLGNLDDTMLKWHEKYCELPKRLATQVSILTDEPFYKLDGKSLDNTTFFTYCGTDAHVTEEISNRLTTLLPSHAPTSYIHYRFNHALLNCVLYMELRGMSYNKALAKKRFAEVEDHIYTLQSQLDALAGYSLPVTPEERVRVVREVMAYKRDPTVAKKDYTEIFPKALEVAAQTSLSPRDVGFLGVHLGLDLNIKSARFRTFLKDKFGEDVPYTDEGNPKADALTLMRLWKKTSSPLMELAMQIGWLRTRRTFLSIKSDSDGRIRSSYNVVGTDTGRLSSSTSPTGSGYNLTTLPDTDESKPPTHPLHRGMRDLIVADPGCVLFQCDLKGSDGWTIGAHLNRLGDSTMLDDLRFGIKPAARIAYMLRHGNHSLRGKTRDEVKHLLLEIKKSDWDYFALKIGIWGICYLMGPDLLADVVFEESDGAVNLKRKEVQEFKAVVMNGYRVELWHNWMARHLREKPTLLSASGNLRRFYSRPTDILGNALSHEPQNNTTYATNLAAYRLWIDPDNRTSRLCDSAKGPPVRVPFWIEPLHQVHDALIGQFPISRTAWAVAKIREYFNNPLTIAGQQIVIPFEGHYGPSWGEQIKENII